MKPLNGNVLVTIVKNQTEDIFSQSDSRKDLQYAIIDSVSEGSKLKVSDKIVYNPRDITHIVYNGDLKGLLHEGNIKAIL